MFTEESFIVIGAGGHARVVVDAWLQVGGLLANLAVFDDNAALAGFELIPGIRIAGGLVRTSLGGKRFHVAIGNNVIRERYIQDLARDGGQAHTVIHSHASVAVSAFVGAGSFVAAQAVVGTAARIGVGAIINHAAVVDHDCCVGSGAHVAPGAVLGGGVQLAARVLVGAGAVILPGLQIGEDAVVGAGAVVTRDVMSHQTVAGVPARTFPRHD